MEDNNPSNKRRRPQYNDDLYATLPLSSLRSEHLKLLTKDQILSYLLDNGISATIEETKPQLKQLLRDLIEKQNEGSNSFYSKKKTLSNLTSPGGFQNNIQNNSTGEREDEGIPCVLCNVRKQNRECKNLCCKTCCNENQLQCMVHNKPSARRKYPLTPNQNLNSSFIQNSTSLPTTPYNNILSPQIQQLQQQKQLNQNFSPNYLSQNVQISNNRIITTPTNQYQNPNIKNIPSLPLQNNLNKNSQFQNNINNPNVTNVYNIMNSDINMNYLRNPDTVRLITCPLCKENIPNLGSSFFTHVYKCNPNYYYELIQNDKLLHDILDRDDKPSNPIEYIREEARERYQNNMTFLKELFSLQSVDSIVESTEKIPNEWTSNSINQRIVDLEKSIDSILKENDNQMNELMEQSENNLEKFNTNLNKIKNITSILELEKIKKKFGSVDESPLSTLVSSVSSKSNLQSQEKNPLILTLS